MQAWSRRKVLTTGVTAATVATVPLVWRPAGAARRLQPTPSQSEGPFYPVRLPMDQDGDLLRNGNATYRQGQPAWVEGVVTDLDGKPLAGAHVDIWQCDHEGHYHHPGDGGRADPAFQGFGRVQLGREGEYRFRTIRPTRYGGRTPHIHVKVWLGRDELLTTQLYVEGEATNERDPLWRRLSADERRALTVPFALSGSEVRARFPMAVAV